MRGKKSNKLNYFFLTCLLLLFCFLLDVLLRFIIPPDIVPKGVSYFHNFTDNRIYDIGLGVFDEDLGWAYKPNTEGHGLFDEYQSFDNNGFRNNDNNITLNPKPTILAIGDSYTFGSEVDNKDTWPSKLEAKLGVKVINGGVSSYGLGQMLTRTKAIMEIKDVDIILVSIISEDIKRVKESKRHGYPKPYYSIDAGKLVLNKVSLSDKNNNRDLFKRVFGYSYIVHRIMLILSRDYWIKGSVFDMQEANIDETEVSCKIIDEFARIISSNSNKHVVFIALPYPTSVSSSFAFCTGKIVQKYDRASIFDLRYAFFNEIEPDKRDDYNNDLGKGYHNHYNPKGTEFVADRLSLFIKAKFSEILGEK